MKYISTSQEQTKQIAHDFACSLKGGECIELIGDLGAGKTVFVRGMAEALGSNARVKSPTFTIMNEYPLQHENIKKLVHMDLYRFNDPEQLAALALDDLVGKQTVICIEWPDRFDDDVFCPTHKITLKYKDEFSREIFIQAL